MMLCTEALPPASCVAMLPQKFSAAPTRILLPLLAGEPERPQPAAPRPHASAATAARSVAIRLDRSMPFVGDPQVPPAASGTLTQNRIESYIGVSLILLDEYPLRRMQALRNVASGRDPDPDGPREPSRAA